MKIILMQWEFAIWAANITEILKPIACRLSIESTTGRISFKCAARKAQWRVQLFISIIGRNRYCNQWAGNMCNIYRTYTNRNRLPIPIHLRSLIHVHVYLMNSCSCCSARVLEMFFFSFSLTFTHSQLQGRVKRFHRFYWATTRRLNAFWFV